MHDVSKFSPTEFFESVKYYKGTSSPINEAKRLNGYSKAWQHHKGRNPHHYEYWTDNYDKGTTCIKMPFKYVVEMLCDYLGAYSGKEFSYFVEYEWWKQKRLVAKMHPETREFLDIILKELSIQGSDSGILNKEHLREVYDSTGEYYLVPVNPETEVRFTWYPIKHISTIPSGQSIRVCARTTDTNVVFYRNFKNFNYTQLLHDTHAKDNPDRIQILAWCYFYEPEYEEAH